MIATQSLRRWRPWGKPSGITLVRAIPVIALAMLILCALSPAARNELTPQLATWYSPITVNTYRARIVTQLSAQPGLHLVIVRYSPEHVPVNEWVFNGADIDQSTVVWARDMGADQNSELIRYFKDRQVWLVEPDSAVPKLSPYLDDGSFSTWRDDLNVRNVARTDVVKQSQPAKFLRQLFQPVS
jgi:hypothetical protein